MKTALLATVALLLGSVAHAQVQKCQVEGRLIFQSGPCAVEGRAAPAHPPMQALTTAAAPRKKTLADLLRERDGADRSRPATREFQGDGAMVLRARMGAV
jgi:hypothetical protein